MLEIRDVDAGYEGKQVLFGVSVTVGDGDIVALIGPNGAGKSTVLKVACGLLRPWRGEVFFEGERLTRFSSAERVSRGVVYSPQGNRVFRGLTVLENLQIAGSQLPRESLVRRVEETLHEFPALKPLVARKAGTLSGGEQQVLAFARALVPKPKLLLLDEPSLGLAPKVARGALERIAEIGELTGTSVLLVEQKARDALSIADRAYGLRLGRVAAEGAAGEILEQRVLEQIFL